VSVNEMNQFLKTLIIIPITSTIKTYPWRIPCMISGKQGSIAPDQIKVVDRARIGSKIGTLSKTEVLELKDILRSMLID
jgi:mRNA interferase MazF